MTLYVGLAVVVWGGVITAWIVILLAQRRVYREGMMLAEHGSHGVPRLPDTYNVWPSVTVVIPAKNEAESLPQCLRHVLAQRYPYLSVIVIDDCSSDETASIAQSFARENPRVRFEQVRERPDDWMGKSYALWLGSQMATGDWLLFIDVDCTLEPGSVSTAIAEALKRDVQLLTLWPRHLAQGFWEHMLIPLCAAMIAMWFGVRRPYRPADPAFANGQFILIRRDAYNRIGGHGAVHRALIEDIPLAEHARRHNVPSWVGSGRDLFGVHMYTGYTATRDGWARIFVGALRSGIKLLASVAWLLIGSLLPFVAAPVIAAVALSTSATPGTQLLLRITAGLCSLHLLLLYVVSYRFWGFGRCNRRYLLLYPVSVLLVVGILLRSWWWLIVRRSVRWRQTRYAIDRRGEILNGISTS